MRLASQSDVLGILPTGTRQVDLLPASPALERHAALDQPDGGDLSAGRTDG